MPGKSEPKDPGAAAADAELARQGAVTDAVAEAHEKELPKLGGPELNPGNPGHDPESGKAIS